MLKHLDLFSGIGGFALGLERTGGFETVAFCEIDPYCRKVLAKHWPSIPIHEDVRELTGDAIEPVDIITGGYPCQPFSLAGKRGGEKDDRHLWPEMHRLVATIRPRWVIAENVAGHINMGLDEVLSDLEGEGYTAWPVVLPACAVDAPHRRDRVWIVANASERRRGGSGGGKNQQPRRAEVERTSEAVAHAHSFQRGAGSGRPDTGTNGRDNAQGCGASSGGAVADANLSSLQGQRPSRVEIVEARYEEWEPQGGGDGTGQFWTTEPELGRVAHGIPKRVDRLKGLGNAVVPQIPEIIGRAILKAERVAA